MARDFDGSDGQARNGNAVISGTPCSMFARVYPDDINDFATLVGVTVEGSGDTLLLQMDTGGEGRINHFDGSSAVAQTTGVFTQDAWNAVGAVFTSDASRTVHIRGESVTNTTSQSAVTGMDVTTIGYLAWTVPQEWFNGRIADVGIWNAILTSAEFDSYDAGVSAKLIRPSALVAQWDVFGNVSPEPDHVGGFNMTITGTAPKVAHPPIIYPSNPAIIHVPAAAVIAATEVRQVFPPAISGVLGGARGPMGPDV